MGWFKRSRVEPHPLADTSLWMISLHVKPVAEKLPASFVGAYVKVFCQAPDATLAVWTAIQAIESMGYSVPETPTSAECMRAADYGAYVDANWPEFANDLASQAELYARIADHRVVLGPFGAYDQPSP